MFLLKDYISRGTTNRGAHMPRQSYFHGIPMDKLEVTKILLANLFPGQKFRIRYRGKRAGYRDGRSRTQHQQDCLKQYAETFAVY